MPATIDDPAILDDYAAKTIGYPKIHFIFETKKAQANAGGPLGLSLALGLDYLIPPTQAPFTTVLLSYQPRHRWRRSGCRRLLRS